MKMSRGALPKRVEKQVLERERLPSLLPKL